MKQPERWLFVSDVDDTLLGDDSGLAALIAALQTTPHEVITAYNSSRPCASLRETLAGNPNLPTPDYLIGALGTEIQTGDTAHWLADYSQHLHTGWNRDDICSLVEPLNFTPHPPEFQTNLKVSYTVPGEAAYHDVQRRLDAAGLRARLIFSGDGFLDIIPAGSGKGNVIRYLADKLDIDPECVVVAGDSGNDTDMFQPPFKGIVVGNADQSLRQLQGEHIYHAAGSYAWGVLEGLRYWKVL